VSYRERLLVAATEAESIADEIRIIAHAVRFDSDFSAGQESMENAYNRLYWTRHRLGLLVSTLGEGTPRRGRKRARKNND
jgi:hypothetical protein